MKTESNEKTKNKLVVTSYKHSNNYIKRKGSKYTNLMTEIGTAVKTHE